MRLRAAALCWAIAACGESAPAVTAGPGVRVESLAAEERVAIDRHRIPVVDCAPGQLIQRSGDGWRCLTPEEAVAGVPLDPRGVDPAVIAGLEEHRRMLDARVERPRACLVAPGAREYEIAPSSCRVWVPSGEPNHHNWWVLGPVLKLRPNTAGTFHATCPLAPKVCHGGDGVWTRLTLSYLDPDGQGRVHEVSAELYRELQRIAPRLSSNDQPHTSEAEISVELGEYRPDFGPRGSIPAYYRLEITISATNGAQETQFLGARIE